VASVSEKQNPLRICGFFVKAKNLPLNIDLTKLNIKCNNNKRKCNVEAPRATINQVQRVFTFGLSPVFGIAGAFYWLSTKNKGVGTMAQGGWAARGPRASGSSLLP